MSTLKIKLLVGRSGPGGSHSPGESLILPVGEAISLIESNQAEATNKKQFEAAKKKFDSILEEEQKVQAQANAIVKKEALELELRELYTRVALKVAEIEGIILSDEEIASFVDEKMQGSPLGDINEEHN